MIVLNLQCNDSHPFEGWFDSIEDFDRQADSDMVACPMCGDKQVSRLPSGPHVKRSGEVASAAPEGFAQMMRSMIEMAKNSENVAERFPEEARRMHYGETPARSIRGQATLNETRDLLEEGIPVMPVPFPAKEEFH